MLIEQELMNTVALSRESVTARPERPPLGETGQCWSFVFSEPVCPHFGLI